MIQSKTEIYETRGSSLNDCLAEQINTGNRIFDALIAASAARNKYNKLIKLIKTDSYKKDSDAVEVYNIIITEPTKCSIDNSIAHIDININNIGKEVEFCNGYSSKYFNKNQLNICTQELCEYIYNYH